MNWLDIVLLVAAALLFVLFACKIVYRYSRKGVVETIGVWLIAGGLALALVAFVVLRHSLFPYIVRHAHGHIRWLNHGFVPWLLMGAVAAVIGYWFWVLNRNRYHKD